MRRCYRTRSQLPGISVNWWTAVLMHITTSPCLAAGLVFGMLAVSGCSTMNKSECLTVDWQTIGYEDGVAGYSGERIAQHRKACAKYGVTPDLARYQSGRDQGLHEFCRPENGFRLGAGGAGYGGVCPANLEGAFVNAYGAGRQLFNLQAQVSNAQRELGERHRELDEVENEIVHKSAVIVSSDSTGEERAAALVDTKHLAERSVHLKEEIRQLGEDRVRYEHDLDEYRASLPPAELSQ